MCSLQLVEKVCEIAGFFLWNVFSRTCAGKKHRNPPNFRKNLAKPARRPEPNCREKPSEAVFRQSQESTNVLSFAYHRLTRGSMLSGGQNSRWASSSSLVGVSPPSSSSLPATIFARRKVRGVFREQIWRPARQTRPPGCRPAMRITLQAAKDAPKNHVSPCQAMVRSGVYRSFRSQSARRLSRAE